MLSAFYGEKIREEQIPFAKSFEYLNTEPAVTKVLLLDPSVPSFYLEKAYVEPVGQWGELTVPNHQRYAGSGGREGTRDHAYSRCVVRIVHLSGER